MICTKCNVDKEESNYQRYFHSTQNKWRVRKQCTECYYKARVKRKNPDLYYLTNPNYKKCNKCNEWKTMEEYWFHQKSKGTKFAECIVCHKQKDKDEREFQIEMNGGSDRIPMQPNVYTDKYQKEQTFSFLELLGYIYNKEKGIWLKPGIKELINDEIVFNKVKLIPTAGKYRTKISTKTVEKIIEYKNRGWNNEKIGDKLEISDTTVFKYYKQWKDTLK